MKNFMRAVFVIVCVVIVGTSGAKTAEAKKITSMSQAESKAKKKVKNAVVTETDYDYEKGEAIYEVTLFKGTKEYEVTYRAKDGKNIHYSWEEKDLTSVNTDRILSRKACKKLAKKKVKKAKLLSLRKKYDDGRAVYKVKLKKGSKVYKLEYLVEGKKLIEYEWDYVKKSSASTDKGYIGIDKAKKIALKKVPGGTVTKCKLDDDDGVPQYEVEIIAGDYEYEINIHAKTGKILEIERDYFD